MIKYLAYGLNLQRFKDDHLMPESAFYVTGGHKEKLEDCLKHVNNMSNFVILELDENEQSGLVPQSIKYCSNCCKMK